MIQLRIQSSLIKQAPFFIICFALMVLMGCKHVIEYESLDEMVSKAKSNVNTISADDFKVMLDQQQDILIVDCRQGEEFIESHIPGAISVPRGTIGFSDNLTNRRAEVYIYGHTDACSALAADVLGTLKFKKVKMIENGWEGWHLTYPELFEEGGLGPAKKEAPVEESGGCGG